MHPLLSKNFQDAKLERKSSNGEVKLIADSSEVNSHTSRDTPVNQEKLTTNGRELSDAYVSQEPPERDSSLKDLNN